MQTSPGRPMPATINFNDRSICSDRCDNGFWTRSASRARRKPEQNEIIEEQFANIYLELQPLARLFVDVSIHNRERSLKMLPIMMMARVNGPARRVGQTFGYRHEPTSSYFNIIRQNLKSIERREINDISRARASIYFSSLPHAREMPRLFCSLAKSEGYSAAERRYEKLFVYCAMPDIAKVQLAFHLHSLSPSPDGFDKFHFSAACRFA
jgi:hypothetical protein